ncbi:MAG TPA: SMC-Scp complex subunit ScpB [Xenococcaceae cyanobacterium]|jgi:segregation and condensation protein B
MNQSLKLAAKIEAVLYLKGIPLTLEAIGTLLECDREMVEAGLIELINDYAHRASALEVVETDRGYSLQLKSTYNSLLKDLIPAELGKGALRTLAAIALKNPILQTELIALRGSSAYQQVAELVELGFIRKRPQADGRSYWLEVTDKFHQYFEIEQMVAS